MKLRRSLSILAVFLMTNGSLLGSEPEMLLQVRESDLGALIQGKRVALRLVEGARVEVRVRKVMANALVVRVKKSSNPAAYPKGTMQIPRAAVSGIEVREAANRLKQTALTIGAAMGAFAGGSLILIAVGPDEGSGVPAIWGGIAIGAAVAVLMNLPRHSKNVTIVEVVPDSAGEGQPKPTDREQSSRPKRGTSPSVKESLPVTSQPLVLPAFKHNGIGAAAPSLVEQSSQEQLRRQARRAVMRQGIPLHRSGLPERQLPVSRHAED